MKSYFVLRVNILTLWLHILVSWAARHTAMFLDVSDHVNQYSSINKEQHEKHLCNPLRSNYYGKYGRFTRETHALIPESHIATISVSNLFHNIIRCEKCLCNLYVSHWSYYMHTANFHLPYATKFWRQKILADQFQFAKIFSVKKYTECIQYDTSIRQCIIR